jgi:hypothetical protein
MAKHNFTVGDFVEITGPMDPALEDKHSAIMWNRQAKRDVGKLGKVTVVNANGTDIGVETLDKKSHRWYSYNHIKKVKKWQVKKYNRAQVKVSAKVTL